jgi:N-acetylneuraminate epimerase
MFGMRNTCLLIVCVSLMLPPVGTSELKWTRLPSLPDRNGFAGAFAGVSGDALIVAGGANFPVKLPWEGGTKVWYYSVFVLDEPRGEWRSGFKLPRPNAYGVSLTTSNGIACIGGGNATEHFSDAFLLQWDGHQITTSLLPNLPRPCAFMTGALVANTIYIAGGIEHPSSAKAMKTFWALSLSSHPLQWRKLPPWPGPERILAVAGAADESFFLFSGATLSAGAEGKPVRTYLRDAYRFSPGSGWARLPDLPRPALAAPSPAIVRSNSLMLVSGDDGVNVSFKPEIDHPGFPKTKLSYDLKFGQWTTNVVFMSRATAPVVLWRDHIVIPSGETKPGYRTPEVWWAAAK